MKDFPPKATNRDSSSSKGKRFAGASVDALGGEGVGGVDSPGGRKDCAKNKADRGSGGRDGVIGVVQESEDMAVCVLNPGGEEGGKSTDK